MAISEIDEITSKVLKYLENQHPDSTNLKVVTAGIRHEQDWWYVPVQPDKQPSRRFEYYEALAEVENELAEERTTVLLLPVAPDEETPSG